MPRSTSASSMRCLSNVIAVSSIDAQAHACVDQGTTLMSNRARLELHHRVSGLVQRDIDDNVLSSLWARGGHTKKIYDARYAVQLRPQSWVLQGSKWTGECWVKVDGVPAISDLGPSR